MIFSICVPLIARAQETTDYELFQRTIKRQDIRKVKQLISDGADTGIVSDYNQRVLTLAVNTDDPKIFSMIWEALREIDVKSPSTLDAFGVAIKYGFIEAIEKFMQQDEQVFPLF